MKESICSPASDSRVSRWLWAPLVPLLAVGCKSCEPRELVCEPIAIFEVLEPEQGAGAAPFSIERPGPEVKLDALHDEPTALTFTGDNRARIDWMLLGHVYNYSEVIYSPAKGLAQNVRHPEDVYPMRRFFDGKSERVRLGFRSSACREPDAYSGYAFCKFTEDKLFLVADMICRSLPTQ